MEQVINVTVKGEINKKIFKGIKKYLDGLLVLEPANYSDIKNTNLFLINENDSVSVCYLENNLVHVESESELCLFTIDEFKEVKGSLLKITIS